MFSGAVSQDYKINKMYMIHLVHPANLVNPVKPLLWS